MQTTVRLCSACLLNGPTSVRICHPSTPPSTNPYIAAVVVPTSVGLLVLGFIIFCCVRRKRRNDALNRAALNRAVDRDERIWMVGLSSPSNHDAVVEGVLSTGEPFASARGERLCVVCFERPKLALLQPVRQKRCINDANDFTI